jgi:hypothetical protein
MPYVELFSVDIQKNIIPSTDFSIKEGACSFHIAKKFAYKLNSWTSAMLMLAGFPAWSNAIAVIL